MSASDMLKELVERISALVPADLQTLKHDIEKNTQAILSNALAKIEVVTREEFDTQTKVLARTRQKISALEAEVAKLEKLLNELVK